eukprot:RCo011380
MAPDQANSGALALGIAFWVIPPMYGAALGQVKQWDRRREGVAKWPSSKVEAALRLTAVIVLVNADCLTGWNLRRLLLSLHRTQAPSLHTEADFSYLVLRKHPKSEEAWRYRSWLAEQVLQTPKDFAKEFKVCEDCSQRHPRNYYAWSHRQSIADLAMKTCGPSVVAAELEAVRAWALRNISDSSGFVYIQHLLQLLAPPESGLAGVTEMEAQLRFLHSLLMRFPEREGLWLHLRWLLLHLPAPQRATWITGTLCEVMTGTLSSCSEAGFEDPLRSAAVAAFAQSLCLFLLGKLLPCPGNPPCGTHVAGPPVLGCGQQSPILAALCELVGGPGPLGRPAHCGEDTHWKEALRWFQVVFKANQGHYLAQKWWKTG